MPAPAPTPTLPQASHRRRAGLGALADRRPLTKGEKERLGRRVDQRAALLGLDAPDGAGAVLGRGRDPAA